MESEASRNTSALIVVLVYFPNTLIRNRPSLNKKYLSLYTCKYCSYQLVFKA